MPPRTIVYIDGFNLYYGAVRGSAFKWLNLQRFFQLLRPHDNIVKVHYFTALVDGPTRPNQEAYLRALGTLPLVNIVLGKFKKKQVRCSNSACTFAGAAFLQFPKKSGPTPTLRFSCWMTPSPSRRTSRKGKAPSPWDLSLPSVAGRRDNSCATCWTSLSLNKPAARWWTRQADRSWRRTLPAVEVP